MGNLILAVFGQLDGDVRHDADPNHAEGVYGATEFTRRCIAEVLAERVDRGDLTEGFC